MEPESTAVDPPFQGEAGATAVSAPAAGRSGDRKGGLPRLLSRVLNVFASLRAKLILPYVLLTLLLAFVGIFVITRLVTSSVRERFVNQLYEAGRVSADGVVRQEQEQLSTLRLMTFTVGVPAAVSRGDADALSDLLWPLALNEDVGAVVVLDEQGRELLGLIREPDAQQYVRTTGSSFAEHDFVNNVLQGGSDEEGDKFVGLVETSFGQYLFTSGPIEADDGELLGVMLVGSRLETLAQELKSQSLADVIILDNQGSIATSTLAEPEGGFAASGVLPANLSASGVQLRSFELFGRTYQAVYSPWIVRDQVLGTMGVVLPSNFIVSAEATSRNVFSLIFTVGTLMVIVVGYVLAQNIANPILKLRSMAQAVAAGDLEQTSGLRRQDEIGELADAFDVMTARLSSRTEEAKRLYEETVERNRQLAEMYDRLQAAQQQLVQSEKLAAVGQLAAGIVHDVKNPLGVIKGMAEELMLDAEDHPDLKQGLTIIRDNATRANVIVTDLLKFARQSTPSMQKRDLRETVRGCLRLTDYLIRKGKVDARESMPDQAVWLTYDAQQMEQVIINLIQNAVQAMPHGGELRLDLHHEGDEVVLEVSDSGEGIPAENLSRIFEPFFTTKPEGKGTGMGLAVTYGIVSRHGGQIDVESELNEGTTFIISLPKEPVAETEDQGVPT